MEIKIAFYQTKMQQAQLIAVVQTFALFHGAYMSNDADEIFLFEHDKVLFHASKLAVSPVPYTPGAYYVRMQRLYFPPAFTPTELKKYLNAAWTMDCEPTDGFLQPDFVARDLCKQAA